MTQNLKTIRVVAALIEDENGRVLTTQRAKGDLNGLWEFPGGKIESGESPEVALAREIQEELDVCIRVGKHLYTVEYDYPTFHLTMECFICTIENGELHLLEHSQMKWISPSDVDKVDWVPADIDVAKAWQTHALDQK